MSDLPKVAAAGLLATCGAYAMTDGRIAYVGESRRPGRRLSEHAADPAKAFARECFVIGGCDKLLAVDLQFRLTRLAVEAGVVTVWKMANPPEPDVTDAERATHDRIAADALRLLHDAGCRIFHPAIDAEGPAETEEQARAEAPVDEPADPADCEPMAIGVSTVPLGSEEFELRFGGLFARGYWASGRFVVSAGSEVRLATNGSAPALTRSRRDELFAAGVLAPIAGVGDRRRLTVAISFASTSIAAKVLGGAHSAGKWVPRDPTQAVWLA
ncbi:hypothetical protein [Bradyrhizobium japonicum]|uniref:hypothetical protein n=1 Tax=Bradyrhizobium japonicum TaxID=375 RepID=UPI0027153464|nr:hypothetical protein [Bradyrhizobium japonicum]WLB54832.1 hypothetical protein QIH94_02240 [Bradyrhizobium japonicum]WLB63293.1 hypothetical protein QIH96_43645 [Bradyrhizobium japonicum]